MAKRHTTVNPAEKLTCVLDDWEINDAVITGIKDNTKKILNYLL